MSKELDWDYIKRQAEITRKVLNGDLDRLVESYHEWMEQLVSENRDLKAQVNRLKLEKQAILLHKTKNEH